MIGTYKILCLKTNLFCKINHHPRLCTSLTKPLFTTKKSAHTYNYNTPLTRYDCLKTNLSSKSNKLNNFVKIGSNSEILCRYSTSNLNKDKPIINEKVKLSRKEQLKRAVKDYGSTVIVFHVTISLVSLGVCYVLVSSGLPVEKLLESLGLKGSIATNAGTFVTAYAIHKVLAPVRISITLGATPFIVNYLRRIGFLKVKS